MDVLEPYLAFLASLLIILSQLVYVVQVAKKNIQPSLLSWIGWAILIGVSVYSQIDEEGWNWSIIGVLISAIGCNVVWILALIKKNFSLRKSDWYFLVLGILCLVIYIVSESALYTTIFAIIADFILAIPTFRKTINSPSSEKYLPWLLSLSSWLVTFLLLINQSVLNWLFPSYLFLFSLFMLMLALRKKS